MPGRGLLSKDGKKAKARPAGDLKDAAVTASPSEFAAAEVARLSALPNLAELQAKLKAVEEQKAAQRARNAANQKAWRDRKRAKKLTEVRRD